MVEAISKMKDMQLAYKRLMNPMLFGAGEDQLPI
jgi:hypothetical protein